MSMKIGNKAVNKIMVGNKEVQKIVINGDTVYTSGPQPTKYTAYLAPVYSNQVIGQVYQSSPYGFKFMNGLNDSSNWNAFIGKINTYIAQVILQDKYNSQYQSLMNLYLNHVDTYGSDISNIKLKNININITTTSNRLYSLYSSSNGTSSNFTHNGSRYDFTYSSGNNNISTNIIIDNSYQDLQLAICNFTLAFYWRNIPSWTDATYTIEFTSEYLDELLATAI